MAVAHAETAGAAANIGGRASWNVMPIGPAHDTMAPAMQRSVYASSLMANLPYQFI